MRSLVFQLRPADLEADGLVATLRKHIEVLGRVHPARVELTVRGDAAPGARAERELYRIAQEALQNALKHSGAARIALALDLDPARSTLEVTDDGAGFDPADPLVRSQHLGLTVMAERARSVGGRLDLRARPARARPYGSRCPLADAPIRVLIADDHPVVRQGLRTYLELQPDIVIAGEAGGGFEAAARGASGCGLTSSCSTWSCPRATASRPCAGSGRPAAAPRS